MIKYWVCVPQNYFSRKITLINHYYSKNLYTFEKINQFENYA